MFSCAVSTVIGKATLPQFVSSVVFNEPLKSELCMQSLVHWSQVVVVQRLVKKSKDSSGVKLPHTLCVSPWRKGTLAMMTHCAYGMPVNSCEIGVQEDQHS